MSVDLLWPGDERAGELMSDATLLAAMVRVEVAWLDALVAAGIAPAAAGQDAVRLDGLVDVAEVAARAEASGNPVAPLVALLRERTGNTWLHRGLTSQDVLDTALMLGMADVLDRLRAELAAQADTLAALADAHRGTVMAGRTLTQHAVPITFGLKAAAWLTGVLDARDALDVPLPVQIGGAAGTLAAPVELAARAGLPDQVTAALALVERTAGMLGLAARTPWHTARAPVTRLGDALATCTDAFGRIANDVLTLARPEIAELAEPAAAGRGASSTMPQKANPVLAVLVRRAALAAPQAAAALHLAAADARDERPDGAWHVEWATLRTLARRTVVAASQTTELVAGLRVHADRMRATAQAAAGALLAEQRAISAAAAPGGPGAEVHPDPGGYLGATDHVIDAVRRRHEEQK